MGANTPKKPPGKKIPKTKTKSRQTEEYGRKEKDEEEEEGVERDDRRVGNAQNTPPSEVYIYFTMKICAAVQDLTPFRGRKTYENQAGPIFLFFSFVFLFSSSFVLHRKLKGD